MLFVRTVLRSVAPFRRAFSMALSVFALILGILAMHGPMTSGHSESMEMASLVAPAASDMAPSEMTTAEFAAMAVHTSTCAEPCGEPADPMSHTSMLAMCVLALMAAVLAILAPALISWLPARWAVWLGAAGRFRDAINLRPPSLVALSISRT